VAVVGAFAVLTLLRSQRGDVAAEPDTSEAVREEALAA
jgi:hypothetical protein